MSEVNPALVAALRQAKAQPMRFAFIPKGTADGALLVGKTRPPVSQINGEKSRLGSVVAFQGRCFFDGATLVFEVPREPPGALSRQLHAVIHRDAGLSLTVEIRVATGLEEDQEVGETPAAASVAPAATPAARTAVLGRLKALSGALKAALGHKGADVARLQTLAGGATQLIQKEHYAEADKALDLLEATLTHAASAPGTAAPPPFAAEPQAHFVARLKALMPQLAHAAAGPEVKALLGQAQELARGHDFTQGNAVLDRLEALLRQTATPPVAAPPAAPPTAAVWSTAKEAVDGQLTALAEALRGTGNPRFVRIADLGLHGVSKNLNVGLLAALMDFDGTAGEARTHARDQALTFIDGYKKLIKEDTAVRLCDENPFQVPVSIRLTLGKALLALEKALHVAAR